MKNGNYLVDPTFRKFLDYMKQKYGMIQSRIIQIAILEKYAGEYEEFMKNYEKGTDNNAEKDRG